VRHFCTLLEYEHNSSWLISSIIRRIRTRLPRYLPRWLGALLTIACFTISSESRCKEEQRHQFTALPILVHDVGQRATSRISSNNCLIPLTPFSICGLFLCKRRSLSASVSSPELHLLVQEPPVRSGVWGTAKSGAQTSVGMKTSDL
jgi:hypothetical protein